MFGAAFGAPGVFGSGFAVVSGSVLQLDEFCFSVRLNVCSCVRQASKVLMATLPAWLVARGVEDLSLYL